MSPPTVKAAITEQTADDGDTISLDVSGNFEDLDVDSLSFTATGLPSGLSISASGVISGMIASDASTVGGGVYTVDVTADDGTDKVTDTFTFTVSNVAPTVKTAIADQTADDGDTVSLDVSGNFEDLDADSLSFTATGLPSGLSISASGVISGTIASDASTVGGGVYTVDVTADDGTDKVTDTFTFTVSNVAPTVKAAITEQTADDGDTISLDVSGNFEDLDADSLSFTATGLPSSLSISASGVISGMIASDASTVGGGVYTVDVTADDGTDKVMDTFTFTVSNVAPTSSSIPTQNSNDGELISLDISSYFTDNDLDALTYSVSGLPAGFSIDANGVITGSFASDASVVGVYSVTVSVDDGEGGIASETFTWNVTNTVPSSSGIPDQLSTDLDNINFDLSAYFADSDGDFLTYTATNLPPGLSVDSSGVIRGQITEFSSTAGPYVVSVEVTDADGAVNVQSFVWDVLELSGRLEILSFGGNDGAGDAINIYSNTRIYGQLNQFVSDFVFERLSTSSSFNFDRPLSESALGVIEGILDLNLEANPEVAEAGEGAAAEEDFYNDMLLSEEEIRFIQDLLDAIKFFENQEAVEEDELSFSILDDVEEFKIDSSSPLVTMDDLDERRSLSDTFAEGFSLF